jgi:uncharacterized protein (DUF1697 family)
MPDYVAFLRAVNLGKHRKLPMADARAWLADAGLTGVETYIQTGNLRFGSSLRARHRVERLVEEVLQERCGFVVPTMVLTPVELREVYDAARALEVPADDDLRRYVTFLKRDPAPGAADELVAWPEPGEGARLVGRAVHWWLARPMQQSRLGNERIERLLGPATTRDLKVVTTLAERWGRAGRPPA